jgi:hypothetical protein
MLIDQGKILNFSRMTNGMEVGEIFLQLLV